MKESILGRSKFSMVLRMVVLTGFLFFIGLGSTFAQNYLPNSLAVQVLKAELNQIDQDLNVSHSTARIAPDTFVDTNPQLYANWFMLEAAYGYMSYDETAKAAEAIEGAYDKGTKTALVGQVFFLNAKNYLEELLSVN